MTRRPAARPALVPLEDRATPAISVAETASTVAITFDDAGGSLAARVSGGAVELSLDGGAFVPLTAAPGGVTAFTVAGGAGNDAIDLSGLGTGLTALAALGKGVVVTAGAGDDTVTGSGLNDDIDGGPGRDVLDGGDGDDTLRAVDYETDTIDGGAGRDAVYFDSADNGPVNTEVWNPFTPAADNRTQKVRVLVLNYDPLVPSAGNRPFHQVMGWNDPGKLAAAYEEAFERTSGGYLDFEVVGWRDLNQVPALKDGTVYDVEAFRTARAAVAAGADWRTTIFGQHAGVSWDYGRSLAEQGVPALVNAGAVDEVWFVGDHYFGLQETNMGGPGAFFINGDAYPDLPTTRPFAWQTLNYERAEDVLMHAAGHRTESTMNRVYGPWDLANPANNWEKFSANAFQSNGVAGVGTAHYPANGTSDYDYANPRTVQSSADDFLDYPGLDGVTRPIDREAWGRLGGNEFYTGADYQQDYFQWYFTRFPRAAGTNPDGKQNNWWKYVTDFVNYTPAGQPLPLRAQAVVAPDLLLPRTADATIAVTFAGATQVERASVDGDEVTIVGPNGTRAAATLVSVSDDEDRTVLVATYRVAPPGGGWDAADLGAYRVELAAGSVEDVGGGRIAGGVVGGFLVRGPDPAEAPAEPDTAFLAHFADTLDGADGETASASSGVTFADGVAGRGAAFDGSGFARYPVAGNLPAAAGAVEFWFRPTWDGTDTTTHNLFTAGNISNNGAVVYYHGPTHLLSFQMWGDDPATPDVEANVGRGYATSVSDWKAGEWHHVVATWDGAARRMELFIDGVSRSVTTDGVVIPAWSSKSFTVGGSPAGTLDEFRVSDTLFDAARAKRSHETAAALSGLAVGPVSLALAAGERSPLAATVTATPGGIRAAGGVVWASSDPAVVVVDPDGMARAVGAGTATLTATLGGLTATVAVTVTDPGRPAASLTAAGVSTAGGTAYRFAVTFADPDGVAAARFGNRNVRVVGPNGFSRFARFVSVSPAGDGSPRTATYEITPPDGSWDFRDNGDYRVELIGWQVADAAGAFAAPATLGAFAIAIPSPLVPPPNAAPTVADIPSQGASSGLPTAPIPVRVTDDRTAASDLVLTAESSDPDLIPAGGIVLGGFGRNRTLTITPAAGRTGAATITLIVADADGLMTPTSFVLTVSPPPPPPNAAPTVSDVRDLTAGAGVFAGPIGFTVSDTETPADQLTVVASSSNLALIPDAAIVLGGAGVGRTVGFTPAAGQTGTATITLTVADGGGRTATDSFVVTVTASPPPPPGFDPTGIEQEMLELLNAMRADPAAGLALMVDRLSPIHSPDPDVNGSIQGVNGAMLSAQFAALTAAAPLAWHPALQTAAAAHNAAMIAADQQSHQVPGEPGLGTRFTDAGYAGWSAVAENVFAFSVSAFYAHAGFAIDWGGSAATGGMQSPPGHRQNMMDPTYREVGIVATPDANPATSVGPLVVTQEFGTRFALADADPYLLGVAYADRNGDGRYNAGEGLAGVVVSVVGPGGTFAATTMTAGGYQLRVPAGAYTVTFSGGDLGRTVTRAVAVGGDNLKVDATGVVVPANAAPTISDVADQSTAADTPLAPLSFTVADAETAADQLTVAVAATGPTLATFALGGTGANRTLTVTPTGATGTAAVTLTVTDAAGATATVSFQLTVTPAASGNTRPTVSAIPDQTTAASVPLSPLAFTVGDAESGPAGVVVVVTSSNPTLVPAAGLVLGGGGASRTLAVAPAAGQGGTATITVTVTDPGGLSASAAFQLTVSPPPPPANRPPVVGDIPSQTLAGGASSGAIPFGVGDPDTGPAGLSVTAVSSDPALIPAAGLVVGGSGGLRTITVTPAAGRFGSATVTVTVADGDGATATTSFAVDVPLPDGPPTVSGFDPVTLLAGGSAGPIAFTVADAHTPAAGLTVTAVSSDPALIPAAGLALGGGGATRTLTVTPAAGRSGTATVTVTVTDAGGRSALARFPVTVLPPGTPDNPPTITDLPDLTAAPGAAVGPLPFVVTDDLTVPANLLVSVGTSDATLTPLAGLVLGGSGSARTLSITPAAGRSGTATITLTVTDAAGHATADTFRLTVGDPGTSPPPGPPPGPNTPPTITAVANQTLAASGTTGPLAFTVGDAETDPGNLGIGLATSNALVVPLSAIVLGGTGANRTVTVTPNRGVFGTARVTLTVADGAGGTAAASFTVTVPLPPPPPPRPPLLVGTRQFATGSDAGGPGVVRVFDSDTTPRLTVRPFGDFTGGVRVAVADVTGDGVNDVAAGTGPGGPSRVAVFDGRTGAEVFSFAPFEAAFTGGVFVAAGDVTGDGRPDLIVSPDEGGGPRVTVLSGDGFAVAADFFGIDDPNFRGGARTAVGDFNGDGVGDLLVAAGFGGGPRVAGYDGRSLKSGQRERLFDDFFAFEDTLRNGVYLTAGDLNGDGVADVIAGGGPGGGPRVLALSGRGLAADQRVPLANFFAGDPNNRAGVRLAVKDLDGDAKADLVVGPGTGAGGRATGYLGSTIPADGQPLDLFDVDAIDGLTDGVFVG